ncbi:hypothetical protein A2159_01325 [Candidatus Woesebacteria bacterium RBG_13_34_9]|uniref:Uncharacterized protein n=1 Tax=Candidatus Woesebacteria bacterium RBG_13_34_9 TaxID=1802477 RepID=A0A1F7X699_9BACT|nr:MAG: hypothetical protein A2159_01325 [Candidatus Woesebacteria bacterium RBG_13_34_9]
MDNKTENLIQTNAEAVELFAKLEKMSVEKPDVFQFFLSRYGAQMLDYYNWGNALWNVDERPVGILDKFIPYITVVMVLIFGIIGIVKK